MERVLTSGEKYLMAKFRNRNNRFQPYWRKNAVYVDCIFLKKNNCIYQQYNSVGGSDFL